MMVTRRTILKQLGIISGGILLLPGCVSHSEPATIALKNIAINGDQEKLFASVVDTILPAGELPGATALDVPHFALRMIDDCQGKENQKIFVEGLDNVNVRSEKEYHQSFAKLTVAQRTSLLAQMFKDEAAASSGKQGKPGPDTFLSLTKRYTIQGFMQSEYVMTNVIPYNMIPGRFDGCIPMEKNKKIIAG